MWVRYVCTRTPSKSPPGTRKSITRIKIWLPEYRVNLKRSYRQMLSVKGANMHPTPVLMGTGEVEFHTQGTIGKVNCKSYKKQMLVRSILAIKLPQRQRVGGG